MSEFLPIINLPSGLEGVRVFIQILALHSFYVVFMCFKYTLFQICIEWWLANLVFLLFWNIYLL